MFEDLSYHALSTVLGREPVRGKQVVCAGGFLLGRPALSIPCSYPVVFRMSTKNKEERTTISQGLLSPCQEAQERGRGLLDVTDSLTQTDRQLTTVPSKTPLKIAWDSE